MNLKFFTREHYTRLIMTPEMYTARNYDEGNFEYPRRMRSPLFRPRISSRRPQSAHVEGVCARFRGIVHLCGKIQIRSRGRPQIHARDICVRRPRKTNFPAHISRFPKSIFLRNKLLIYGHTADCKSPSGLSRSVCARDV